MRTVFMGTPQIAAVILEAMIKAGIFVAGVVTQPDKPKGRGNEVACPDVKKIAIQYNIPVFQPIKVKDADFQRELENLQPDIIVVVAFGQILPKAVLELPRHGCINVHASLLPKYRGAAPIQWAIINGEEVTGVTIIYMDEGIDTGAMIRKEEVFIDKKETAASLHDKLALAGANALLLALKQIEEGSEERIPQDNSLANYARMLDKSCGNIDFNQSAVSIERLIRGLNPWPSAYTYLNGRMLKIWDAEVAHEEDISIDAETMESGTVVSVGKTSVYVKTGEGYLKLITVQPEGKKRMSCGEFLRGYQITKGTLLG